MFTNLGEIVYQCGKCPMIDNIEIPYCGALKLTDARLEKNVARVRRLIETEPFAFSRELLSGHITGSAFIINQTRDKVLLTHHAKLDIWIQLGGHCDGIKDPFFTAWREAYEESGLTLITPISQDIFDIDIHQIPQKGTIPAHLHYDLRYLFEADDDAKLTISSESHDLRWVSLSKLSDYQVDRSVLVIRDGLDAFLNHID